MTRPSAGLPGSLCPVWASPGAGGASGCLLAACTPHYEKRETPSRKGKAGGLSIRLARHMHRQGRGYSTRGKCATHNPAFPPLPLGKLHGPYYYYCLRSQEESFETPVTSYRLSLKNAIT